MGIEDKLNQVKGALKEGAGKLSGDKKTQAEGAVEKVVAKAKDGSTTRKIGKGLKLNLFHEDVVLMSVVNLEGMYKEIDKISATMQNDANANTTNFIVIAVVFNHLANSCYALL